MPTMLESGEDQLTYTTMQKLERSDKLEETS